MRCVANFEVGADVSIVTDCQVLEIREPRGAFRARIKNIPRSEFTTPFLLSVHIYYDAETLDSAKDQAEFHLATLLNMLAFTTGSGLRRHRIRQIVDADAPKGAMRDVRMWGDSIEYDDPQPFLDFGHAKTIERLLEFDIPPAIRRALRWYRLGVDAETPDDQFTYFWFAVEIIAEFRTSSVKVNDKCPQCQSPLFCEQCATHPVHKPYPKQAIFALLKSVDKECSDQTVTLLDKTRNSLMHGKTLKEIEDSLPKPHERIVDTLGRLLWMSLVLQFPNGFFDGSLVMGQPGSYVRYKTAAVGHIQTIVPVDAEGNFDLNFTGMTMTVIPFGPPQSELPSIVRLSPEQSERLIRLSYREGPQKELLGRIAQSVREQDGQIYALILSTDIVTIRNAIGRHEEVEWLDLLREFIDTAKIAY